MSSASPRSRAEPTREIYAGDIDLVELWRRVWRGRWAVLLSSALFGAAAVVYVLFADDWYRAEVLLAPAEPKQGSSLPGQLSGLAALAGVSIGGGEGVEALATLESRRFTRSFIDDEGLMRLLLDVAPESKDAVDDAAGSSAEVDIRDAVKVFRDQIMSVRQDAKTGLVEVAVEWKEPELAALWANRLVERLNERMRQQALDESRKNLAYLQEQLSRTSVVPLQQSIGRLVEAELQKQMLADGSEEFAFRVIDEAQVPKEPSRPDGVLVVMLGVTVGMFLGAAVALIGPVFSASRS